MKKRNKGFRDTLFKEDFNVLILVVIILFLVLFYKTSQEEVPILFGPGDINCDYVPGNGDFIVDGMVVVCDQRIIAVDIDKDLIVRNGGSLTIKDSTINFQPTVDGGSGVLVESGGELIVWKSLPAGSSRIRSSNPKKLSFVVDSTASKFQLLGGLITNVGWSEVQGERGVEVHIPFQNGDFDDGSVGNSYNGMVLYSDGNTILGGPSSFNTNGAGIVLKSNNNLIKNVKFNNQGVGIRLDASHGNVLDGNTFSGSGVGVYSDVLNSNNQVINNNFANSGAAIKVEGSCNGCLFQDNVINGPINGISVSGNNNQYIGNQVISLSGDVADGIAVFGTNNQLNRNLINIGRNLNTNAVSVQQGTQTMDLDILGDADRGVLVLGTLTYNDGFINNMAISDVHVGIKRSGGSPLIFKKLENVPGDNPGRPQDVPGYAFFNNVTFDESKAIVKFGDLDVKWNIGTRVKDIKGILIEGAAVHLVNDRGTTDVNSNTNLQGEVPQVLFQGFIQTPSLKDDYRPYRVEVTKIGYQDYMLTEVPFTQSIMFDVVMNDLPTYSGTQIPDQSWIDGVGTTGPDLDDYFSDNDELSFPSPNCLSAPIVCGFFIINIDQNTHVVSLNNAGGSGLSAQFEYVAEDPSGMSVTSNVVTYTIDPAPVYSIDISQELLQNGIVWDIPDVSSDVVNGPAVGNDDQGGDQETLYHIEIRDNNIDVDLCVHVDGDFVHSVVMSETIEYQNEKYSWDLFPNVPEALPKIQFDTSNDLVYTVAAAGQGSVTYVYFKFYLDVNVGQLAGEYSNAAFFDVAASGECPVSS